MNAPEIASEAKVMFLMAPAYEVAEGDGLVDRIAGCDTIEAAKTGESERRNAVVERVRCNRRIADQDSGIQCRIVRSVGEEVGSQGMRAVPGDCCIVGQPSIADRISGGEVITV